MYITFPDNLIQFCIEVSKRKIFLEYALLRYYFIWDYIRTSSKWQPLENWAPFLLQIWPKLCVISKTDMRVLGLKYLSFRRNSRITAPSRTLLRILMQLPNFRYYFKNKYADFTSRIPPILEKFTDIEIPNCVTAPLGTDTWCGRTIWDLAFHEFLHYGRWLVLFKSAIKKGVQFSRGSPFNKADLKGCKVSWK